jgi:diguanylate cyclase (GGDEF)-like protein/PAS domain S-box-containing protein
VELGKTRELLDNMFEGVYIVDRDRTIVYWNAAAQRLTGYPAGAVIGKRCHDDLMMHVNDKGEVLCNDKCPLASALQGGEVKETTVFLRHSLGHRIPVDMRAVPLRDDAGTVRGMMEVFTRSFGAASSDQLKELAHKAFVDSLTGVPNKEYTDGKLRSLLSSQVPGEGRTFGLVFVELANLREINEDFSMQTANAALRVMARTIAANLEPGDLVGRWYGGLFLVVSRMDKKTVMLNWANKIKALVQQSKVEDGGDIPLKVCIGGVFARRGENANLAYQALEGVLKSSRAASGNIVIRET